MNKTDLMFKEAFEDLKPYWEPKDGDQIYVEYSEADKQFSKEHYPDKEDHNGFWYIENHIKFQSISGNGERYIEHLRSRVTNWRARQEDLIEIHGNKLVIGQIGTLQRFIQWYHNIGLPPCLQINCLWLCFVMETCFNKMWDGKSWVVVR